MKRKLYDLKNQRAARLSAAQSALEGGDREAYDAEMSAATAMNREIADLENLIAEQERFSAPAAPASEAERRDRAEDRAETLRNGGSVTFTPDEVLDALGVLRVSNSTTLGTGSLVEPTRGGTTIRDRLSPVSSILDQVSVVALRSPTSSRSRRPRREKWRHWPEQPAPPATPRSERQRYSPMR